MKRLIVVAAMTAALFAGCGPDWIVPQTDSTGGNGGGSGAGGGGGSGGGGEVDAGGPADAGTACDAGTTPVCTPKCTTKVCGQKNGCGGFCLPGSGCVAVCTHPGDDDHKKCDADDGDDDNSSCSCSNPGHGKGTGHCQDKHRHHSKGHGNGHCKYDC